jgi:hypothetical protein
LEAVPVATLLAGELDALDKGEECGALAIGAGAGREAGRLDRVRLRIGPRRQGQWGGSVGAGIRPGDGAMTRTYTSPLVLRFGGPGGAGFGRRCG